MKHLVLIPLLLALAGCRTSEPCTPKAARCVGNVAEQCVGYEYVHELMDCDQVSAQSGESFVCGYLDEETPDGRVQGHTCVLASEARGGAGAGGGAQ